MAIFKVRVATDLVVEAASPEEAKCVARMSVLESYSSDFAVDFLAEVTELEALPAKWDGMCLPYNGDGKTRLRDLLKG